MKNKAIGIVGLILISFIACLAIFAPLIAQYDPNAVVGPSYAKPSAEFLLGTNDVGYDIFSELVYGAQYSLLVGLTSAAIAAGVGGGGEEMDYFQYDITEGWGFFPAGLAE